MPNDIYCLFSLFYGIWENVPYNGEESAVLMYGSSSAELS